MLRRQYITTKINQTNTNQQFIKSQLKEEMEFMNNLLNDNPKEYHIWTYKKDLITLVVNKMSKGDKQSKTDQNGYVRHIFESQKKFIFELIIEDCRNYHAWDYQFWLTCFLGYIDEQVTWINQLIYENKYEKINLHEINNITATLQSQGFKTQQLKIVWKNVYSLWSYKTNLLKYIKDNKLKSLTQYKQMVSQQIPKLFTLLAQNRQNQCLWNYLIGIKTICQTCQIQQLQQQEKELLEVNKTQRKKIYKLQQFNHFLLQTLYGQYFSDQIKNSINENENIGQLKHNLDQLINNSKLNRFELSLLLKIFKTILMNGEEYGLDEDRKNQDKDMYRVLEMVVIGKLKKVDEVRKKYYEYVIRQ